MRPAAGTAVLLAVALAGGLGCDRAQGPPRPRAIEPAAGPTDTPTEVVIRGEDFFVAAQVAFGPGETKLDGRFTARLGGQALEQVRYVDSGMLRAVVPAGLSPGMLDLLVVDPSGREGRLAAAFQVSGLASDGGPDADADGGDGTDGPTPDGDGGPDADLPADQGDGPPADLSGDGPPADAPDAGRVLVAALTVSPPAGAPGTFVFDASGSTGEGLQFAFDLDGDGVFETVPAAGASTQQLVASPGTYVVAVEVTDRTGRRAYARRTYVVASAADLLLVTTGTDEVTDPVSLGGLSLREALQEASTRPGRQVITFLPGLVTTLASPLTGPTGTDGLDIVGGPGVAIDGAGGACWTLSAPAVRVIGVEIRNCSAACLAVDAGATGLVIESSRFIGCQRGLYLNAVGAVIGPDVEVSGHVAQGILVDADDVRLDGVTASGSETGIHLDFRANRADLSRCLVHDNRSHGLQIGVGVDAPSIQQCTVSGNGGHGLLISPNARDVRLRNDLFTFNALTGVKGASGVRFLENHHNGHFGNGQTGEQGTAPLLEDPLYWNAGARDFALQPGSPAIDAGDPAVGIDVNGPAAGLFSGAAPELGALETAE